MEQKLKKVLFSRLGFVYLFAEHTKFIVSKDELQMYLCFIRIV